MLKSLDTKTKNQHMVSTTFQTNVSRRWRFLFVFATLFISVDLFVSFHSFHRYSFRLYEIWQCHNIIIKSIKCIEIKIQDSQTSPIITCPLFPIFVSDFDEMAKMDNHPLWPYVLESHFGLPSSSHIDAMLVQWHAKQLSLTGRPRLISSRHLTTAKDEKSTHNKHIWFHNTDEMMTDIIKRLDTKTKNQHMVSTTFQTNGSGRWRFLFVFATLTTTM